MIAIAVEFVNQMNRVAQATEKAKFRNLGHALARIRKDAVASIEPSDEPSPPGSPPHTRKRISRKGNVVKGHLQRAIVYKVEGDSGVVGPRESIVGESGQAHEFGGKYKGGDYPERAFMGPALDRNLDNFASTWGGSIGEG